MMFPLRCLTLAVALVSPSALVLSQSRPRAEFLTWARKHAHQLQLTGSGVGARDLLPLRSIAGKARVIGMGEPMHTAREVLAIRNRAIQYAVTELGVRSIVLETGLAKSKRLYDHVLGRSTETDAVLVSSFSYGFGNWPDNQELIKWLRAYNARQDPSRAVRIYGLDLTGQITASAAPALLAVLDFVDRVDPPTGKLLRHELADTTAILDPKHYPLLDRREQDALTARIEDLIGLLRRRQPAYVAASSLDDFDWAVQTAINLAQDNVFYRMMPRDLWEQMAKGGQLAIEPTQQFRDFLAMREVAMLENFSWIMQREASRGRIFVFAQNGHLQKVEHRSDRVKQVDGLATFGMFAHPRLGADYVIIGTYFGTGEDFPERLRPPAPDLDGIDGLLASAGMPAFIMDLREISPATPLAEWFSQPHTVRSGNSGEFIESVSATRAFDAILYIDRVTPHAPIKRSQ